MARATDIPGLAPDTPFRTAAAVTVTVRAGEMFAAADGVLDMEAIEGVHDMRVASRRLRAVLEIYAPCFPPRAYRSVLAEVKGLADALGERRDPDVQLASLAGFAKAVGPAAQPGLEEYRRRLAIRQGAGNADLAAVLERIEASDLKGRLHALAAAADPAAVEDEA